MVRPIMEYASAVWDPFYGKDIQQMEKVQCRAARWVLNDYRYTSLVTLMLKQLSRPTLMLRHRISRLSILYKAIHQQLSLTIQSYYLPPTIQSTRQYHPSHFVLPCSSTTSHQHNYFTRTIKDWNSLPTAVIKINSHNKFLSNLQIYIANYGTGHAKIYKITRAAFEYLSKTRELSSSTRGKLASFLRVLELPSHTAAVQCLASETDPCVQVLSCLACYLIARMWPQLKAHKPSKKTPVQV